MEVSTRRTTNSRPTLRANLKIPHQPPNPNSNPNPNPNPSPNPNPNPNPNPPTLTRPIPRAVSRSATAATSCVSRATASATGATRACMRCKAPLQRSPPTTYSATRRHASPPMLPTSAYTRMHTHQCICTMHMHMHPRRPRYRPGGRGRGERRVTAHTRQLDPLGPHVRCGLLRGRYGYARWQHGACGGGEAAGLPRPLTSLSPRPHLPLLPPSLSPHPLSSPRPPP